MLPCAKSIASMANSLREFIKIRSSTGVVWFLTFNETVPPTTALTLGEPQPRVSFEEKALSQIPDFVTLAAPDGGPWYARVDGVGMVETLEADVNGLNMSGYGIAGLILRGSTENRMQYAVSNAGVLSIVNTPAPTNDVINVDYLDGTSRVAFCRQHNLVYRPDERIYRNAATHCPVDGARLRGWRDLVRDRENGEDSASQTDPYDQRW